MKSLLLLIQCFLTLNLLTAETLTEKLRIPLKISEYVCERRSGEIKIDSKLNEVAWKNLKWKLVWVWSMPGKTDKNIEKAVNQAKDLGFNAIAWNPPNWKSLIKYCRKNKMESFYVIGFNTKTKEGIQALASDELKLPSSAKEGESYQSGGEPLKNNREILHSDIFCLRSPVALNYGYKAILEGVKRGYDGIAFDFIGYKNYYRCNCDVCRAEQEEYLNKHPDLNKIEASNRLSRENIVWFYNQMVKYVKSLKPALKTTCHVYPVFMPDILYGNRLPVDYCGQTVSWAYEPHWDFDKILRYTEIVVNDQNQYHKNSIGAPFIACHKQEFLKSPERIRKEIQIVKHAGAQALQMTELGIILRRPELSDVIKKELASKIIK